MGLADPQQSRPSVGLRAIKRWLPIVLVVLGLAALTFGFAFSSVTILVPQKAPPSREAGPPTQTLPPMPPPSTETELFPTIVPPAPLPAPAPAPPPVSATVPEADIVRDVTVGGVERQPDGTIKRTYAAGEQKPALCPT